MIPYWEHTTLCLVRVIAKRTLREFWAVYPDAEEPLKAWHQEVVKADWETPHEVKAQFGSASILGDSRIVFNIAGNKYRLLVKINYPYRFLYIRFIGTHVEYDQIDVGTI